MMVTQISDGVAQLDVETPGSSDFAIEIIHLCSLRLKNYEKRKERWIWHLRFFIGASDFGGIDLAFEIFSRGLGFLAGWKWHLRFFLGASDFLAGLISTKEFI